MEKNDQIIIKEKNFVIIEEIGNGSYSDVVHAKDASNGMEVALKLEHPWIKSFRLVNERKVYLKLQNDKSIFEEDSEEQPQKCIPSFYSLNYANDQYIMIMELLGPSLSKLFKMCNGKFSLKTVLMLADQMLNVIEFIHSRGIVHRDLQPNNFVMGLSEHSKNVFLIDFGCAKKYMKGKSHIEFLDSQELVGNLRFCSIRNLVGIRQTRRDDLQSLAYILIFFLKGSLPWQKLENEDYWIQRKKSDYHYFGFRQEWFTEKYWTDVDELCHDLPPEFNTFLNYCLNLQYSQKPDYAYLRTLMKDVFKRFGFVFDYQYDWVTLKK